MYNFNIQFIISLFFDEGFLLNNLLRKQVITELFYQLIDQKVQDSNQKEFSYNLIKNKNYMIAYGQKDNYVIETGSLIFQGQKTIIIKNRSDESYISVPKNDLLYYQLL